MDWNQIISFQTQVDAKDIGYNEFPISQQFDTTGTIRNTCTIGMLHDWIKLNYHLTIETKYEDSQLWGYVLKWCEGYGTKTLKTECTYIDGDSLFDTEELAFDAGLRRAIEEIKYIQIQYGNNDILKNI